MNFKNQIPENFKKEKFILHLKTLLIFFYVIFFSWIVRLKDKRGFTIVNAFQIILDISKRKPKKIWIDQGIELYDNAFKKSLKYNDIEMYSTYNE